MDSNPAVRRIAEIPKKSLLTRTLAPPFEAAVCGRGKPRPEPLPNARSMTHAQFPRKALGPERLSLRCPGLAVIFAVRLAAQPLRRISSRASINTDPRKEGTTMKFSPWKAAAILCALVSAAMWVKPAAGQEPPETESVAEAARRAKAERGQKKAAEKQARTFDNDNIPAPKVGEAVNVLGP